MGRGYLESEPHSEQGTRSELDLIVPMSHDWTTLGRGGGIETFLKLFIKCAPQWGLKLTVLCSGPREETSGSVRFLPIMTRASGELDFTRQLRRVLLHGKLGLPAGAV